MAIRTITFDVSTAQETLIKEALEHRANRLDPENAPHSFSAAEVLAGARKIMIGALKSKVKIEHIQMGEMIKPTPPDIDDVV